MFCSNIYLYFRSFYGISDDFDSTLLFSTNGDKRRNLYFSTPAVRDIIKLNFERMIVNFTVPCISIGYSVLFQAKFFFIMYCVLD